MRFSQSLSFVNTKAAKNPSTVINPAKSWAASNASGIIVSASMARIAPAATAVVAAITSTEKLLKSTYPRYDANAEMTAIAVHTPKTYFGERCAFFIPDELDSASGMFEIKIAATVTALTAPPLIMLTPIAIDVRMIKEIG